MSPTTYPRIDRALDTIGDGSGTKNANVDGSSTPVLFRINPPSVGCSYLIRMIVTISDAGGFAADSYGNLAELSNGLQVGMFNSVGEAIVEDYLDGLPIKSNGAWSRPCFDTDVKDWGTPTDEFLTVRWTFAKAGTMTLLPAASPMCFGVKVSDDLTGLKEHYFMVQGYSKS